MFVRFRQGRRRLQVSLVETHRVDGKIRHEHIAGLGAIDVPASIPDRVAFWQRLHERLAQLSNRLDGAAQGKILGEIHARIPMVTMEELRELKLENAEAACRLWTALHDIQSEAAENNKGLAAAAERAVAAAVAEAKKAQVKAEAAKDRVARLQRGEAVAGGIGRPPVLEDILRDAGWTRADIGNGRVVAEVSKLGGFDELLAETDKRHKRADRTAARAVLRRRLSASR